VNSCKSVILDDNSNATAEVRLEERGARVQGKVEIGRNIHYSATVYELKSGGSKQWAADAYDNNFQTDPFNINVPMGGTFRMEIGKSIRDESYKYRYEYAAVDFTIEEGQIKNLGPIAFSPTSYFTNKSGNHFSSQPSRALPGSTITLKTAYKNNHEKTAANAVLLLEIPEGMTLVTDSAGNMAVTGAKGTVTLEGNTLIVPADDLEKGAGGTVTYKLKVSPDFDKNSVSAAARIRTNLDGVAVEETIGTVHLDTPKVTLDAPPSVSDADMQTVLTGYAPAGSTVAIYDTDVRIGGAVANAAGIWKTPVTLTDLGSPGMHALWADTVVNNVSLKSEKAYVQYDRSGPQLIRMAFSQAPAGRWISVETGKEASDFTYTVVPGNPFLFDFEFTNPDQVENVRVYMDGQQGDPILAVREGSLFRATVPTSKDALGGIYVDYDVKKEPFEYDGTLPNMDQIREAFPPRMRDFQVVSIDPFELSNGKYSGSVVLRFPQLDDKEMTITLTVDPESSYVPTQEERLLAELSGVPDVQKSYAAAETDTDFTIGIRGYIPRNLLIPESAAFKGAQALAAAKPGDWGDWGHTAEYFMEIKGDVDGVKGHIDSIKGQYEGYKGYADKINKIMYNVETSGMDCIEEMPATAKQAGKALAAVVVGEVAKTALGAWTGAMGLTGPGAAVAGFATGVISNKIDNYVDQQIDAVGTGYNECSDNPDRKKKKGRKLLDPKWIYDPSGYVYEAVQSNPVEGVTATVLYLDTAANSWKVWDAEEYGQVNPQQTDEAGRYGWDVPPGKWKVVWTKEVRDGSRILEVYEPLTSAELEVPPPHTEVNAGLVSRKPPQVVSVTGVTYEGGSYVDIMFSKHLKAGSLPVGAVAVTDASNAVLEGSAVFIKQEASSADKDVMLSRTVRFTPKSSLSAGGAYNVKLNRNYFTSYANAAMLEKDAGPFPVVMKVLDTTGPAVESVKLESSGQIVRITYNEPIQTVSDASRFQLNDTADTVTSAVALRKQGVTDSRELLLTLSGPVTSEASLTLMAGAVKDTEGNTSAAGVMPLTPGFNPALGGLIVGGGTLSPAFSSAVTGYTLQLPAGTKELAVTATAVEASAKLTIGTEPSVSGAAKTVLIPEDGIIRITVELGGGVSVKTYTIQVTYVGNGDGGSGGYTPMPPSAPPATKDPLNLGETAAIKKNTTSSGGVSLEVNISKTAVIEALKDGKKAKELYVEVMEPVDEVVLEFPVDVLSTLVNAQAALLVKTELMNVRLDAAAIMDGGLMGGSRIRLVIAKAEERLAAAASEAALKQNDALQMVTGPVTVHATVVDGSGAAAALPLSAFNALQGEFGRLKGEFPGIYRYDEASGAWVYVQSKKNADGQGLVFGISGPGAYAAMHLTSRFADTDGHWAKQEIDRMARRLLVNGVSQTEFRPEGAVTRAEFAAMLVRALRIPGSGVGREQAFTDVNQAAWYYEAVLAAASKGLVNGLESGRFAPDETITREQMAVMIGRAYRSLGLDFTPPEDGALLLAKFTDGSSVQSWALADAALALKESLMQGVSNDAFEPQGMTTRAQAVVVLGRLLDKQG
jgi:large repetitive protein